MFSKMISVGGLVTILAVTLAFTVQLGKSELAAPSSDHLSRYPQNVDQWWNNFKDRLVVLRPYTRSNSFNRKRSCFINAGMTNNCDFKDLISATSARRIWQSPNLSPGKRSALTFASSPSYTSASSSPSANSASHSSGFPIVFEPFPASLIGESNNDVSNKAGSAQDFEFHGDQVPQKRMQCISGLPGGDCENSFLGGESLGQDFLRPGGRNPGRR